MTSSVKLRMTGQPPYLLGSDIKTIPDYLPIGEDLTRKRGDVHSCAFAFQDIPTLGRCSKDCKEGRMSMSTRFVAVGGSRTDLKASKSEYLLRTLDDFTLKAGILVWVAVS